MILGFSQKTYIKFILACYNIEQCSPSPALIVKGRIFGSSQCPKTEVENEQIRLIHYACMKGNLMYAQVCTCPDIAYVVGMLSQYHFNLGPLESVVISLREKRLQT